MSNFLQNGRFKINGHGKAMVVADSRHNAVRYCFAIKKYIKQHPQECKGTNDSLCRNSIFIEILKNH